VAPPEPASHPSGQAAATGKDSRGRMTWVGGSWPNVSLFAA